MKALRYPIPAALAAMDRRRHQVIEASAGTGKTYLLERCVVDLVVSGAATIDGIAVVTYTEKATAELESRVRRLLQRLADAGPGDGDETAAHAWTIDDDARARIDDALLGFDRAQISTIHALCHRVLAENAFASRRLFTQTQVASEVAFAAAFRAELRERFARDPAEEAWLQAWLEAGDKRSVDGLRRLLYRCSELGGRITPVLDPDRLAAAMDGLAGLDLDPERVAAAMKRGRVHGGKIKAFCERIVFLGELAAAWRARRDPIAVLVAMAGETGKKAADYLGKHLEELRGQPELAGLVDAATELLAAAVPLDAAVVQRFLPAVQARTRHDKDRLGQFDFRDMLELVWRGLDGPAGDALAARLRARWPHALIDEFQDTDDVQWRIFRKVWLDGGGRLVVIGDPKQAIYGFRAADVHTYLAAADEMLGRGAQRTVIRESWRSTAAMVDALNDLCVDDGAASLFDPEGPIRCDQPLAAASPVIGCDRHGAAVAPVELVELAADGRLTADQLRAGHLAFVVDEITALLRDPDRQLLVGVPAAAAAGAGDPPRPVTASDIFVLTRSVREANQVADGLRDAGIRCALYQLEGLFRTAEAAEVRDLLAAIAEPGDPAARLRAWRTRFFAAELDDLPELNALPETHAWVSRLYEWRSLAERLDYETLFARVTADSGVVERDLFRRGSERGITNVQHLFELLLEEVLRSRCEIHELVARLGAWMADEDASVDERDVQRLDSERDAVQVMTIHKSKGLQAGVVFVFGGFDGGGGGEARVYHGDGARQVHVGPGAPAAAQREAEQEDQRLLYVAVTRAVARLYLPLVRAANHKCTGVLAGLQRRLAVLADRIALGDRALAGRFALRGFAPPDREAPGPRLVPSPWVPPPALLGPIEPDDTLDVLRRRRRGTTITSYTRLAARTRSTAAVEPADLKADLDVASTPPPEHQLPGGAATGIFLHAVLEQVDFAELVAAADFDVWRSLPGVDRLFRDLAARHGIAGPHLVHAQRLVHDALALPVALGPVVVPALAGCGRELREVEFLYPTPGGRLHAQGVIDLVFEHDGLTYLLDWKSDMLDDYGAATIARHVRDHYHLQARLYALALVKMLGDGAADRFGGVAYLFLRGRAGGEPGSGVVFERPALAELGRFIDELEAQS